MSMSPPRAAEAPAPAESRWRRSASGALSALWSRPPGQALLRQFDRLLWTLEKSHQWSVPPSIDKPNTGSSELTRPLPWIVFLPLLAGLRILREGASFAALLFGKEPFRPADIVKYIQQRRRAVRAVKYQGTRAMRARSHHARAAPPRRTWMTWVTAPIRLPLRLLGRRKRLSRPLRSHSDKGDGSTGNSRKNGAEDNLFEKLLNADFSDNTSTDDSSYTLKNASDSETTNTSMDNSSNTVEEVHPQQDQNNSSVTESSTKDDSVITVSEQAEDEQQLQTISQSPECGEESRNGPTAEAIPPGAKESTEDMLASERAICEPYAPTKEPEVTPQKDTITPQKERQKNKSPKSGANGEAIKMKDGKSKELSSKVSRKGSAVPVVKVTPAEEAEVNLPTGKGASREGSYYNSPASTVVTSTLNHHNTKEQKKSPTQLKKTSPSPITDEENTNKKSFWRRRKSSSSTK